MWWFIVKLVLVAASAYFSANAGSNISTGMDPGEVQAATAKEGDPIPVLFGTRTISNQNVIWYGDIKTVAIKSSGGKK